MVSKFIGTQHNNYEIKGNNIILDDDRTTNIIVSRLR